MDIITFWLIVAGIGLLGAAMLSWDTIRAWIKERTSAKTAYAEVIRTALSNGQYRVVAGVFDRTDNRIAVTTWDKAKLDAETRQRFGHQDRIRISLD